VNFEIVLFLERVVRKQIIVLKKLKGKSNLNLWSRR